MQGNPFPQGAVLGTVSEGGTCHSRMLGTMLDEKGIPKFHTSPASRKVEDIKTNNNASLTYSFQKSLRSISLEGRLFPLPDAELEVDWLKYDADFRRHYHVFGEKSGTKLTSPIELSVEKGALTVGIEEIRPKSFIGYRFDVINRISFYSVSQHEFAICDLYEFDERRDKWIHSNLVP